MANTNVYFDTEQTRFIYPTTGVPLAVKDYPTIVFKEQKVITWNIGYWNSATSAFVASDLTTYAVTAWQSSVDYDFVVSTNPMIRVLNANIIATNAATGIIVVTYDADTTDFEDAVDGQTNGRRLVNIQLKGNNVAGKLACDFTPIDMQLYARQQVDPGSDPVGVTATNYYTKIEADALLSGKQASLTFGIANTNSIVINAADVADNDYAKFTATGLEGRSYAEVLSDIGAEVAGSTSSHAALTTGVHGVGAGTIAKTSDITATKLDDFTAPDDNTDLNASTSKHGLILKATAPAAGLYNYVGITNGETAYTNKALFDATVPSTQALGDAASAGSAAVAARRDHKHAMPSATITNIGNGSAQYQIPMTGGSPFAPVYTTASGTGVPILNTNPTVTDSLTINGSNGILKINSTAVGGWGRFVFYNHGGVDVWGIGYRDTDGNLYFGRNEYGMTNPALTLASATSNVGIGSVNTPTARLHVPACTATASTAPFKFTQASAVLLSSPEAGAVEVNDGDKIYYTIKTGTARKEFVLANTTLTSGKIPVATTNGRLTDVTPQTELTDELTTITYTAPGTPDYAVQDLVQNSGFGFVTKDEGNTVLSVIVNLQTRVKELEDKLVALGLLADAD